MINPISSNTAQTGNEVQQAARQPQPQKAPEPQDAVTFKSTSATQANVPDNDGK